MCGASALIPHSPCLRPAAWQAASHELQRSTTGHTAGTPGQPAALAPHHLRSQAMGAPMANRSREPMSLPLAAGAEENPLVSPPPEDIGTNSVVAGAAVEGATEKAAGGAAC
mmetsp:Transcript_135828/g.343902  ORF Transcript_135828/g.343902 Transcript_135828/m.343902 type:complete len:112 (-) Transcript_135828:1158-1493(-)